MLNSWIDVLKKFRRTRSVGLGVIGSFFVGGVSAQQPPELQAIQWAQGANIVGGSTPGGLVKSAGGSVWNAGVIGEQRFVGDGRVEFSAKASSQFVIGLNLIDVGVAPGDIDHGIYIQPSGTSLTQGTANVYEGATGSTLGTFTNTTVFVIRREGSKVVYEKDGVTVFTSTAKSSGSVRVDTAFYKVGSELLLPKVHTGDLDGDQMEDAWERALLPPNPSANLSWQQVVGFLPSEDFDGDGVVNLKEYEDKTFAEHRWSRLEPVEWENLVNCELDGSDGGLKRGTMAAGWTADGNSTKRFLRNGYVGFRFGEGSQAAVGLTQGNEGRSTTDLEYRIVSTSTGVVAVRPESSTSVDMGECTAETVFGIERFNGQVRYYKDGLVFLVSTQLSSGPLLVDCSLNSVGARIASVRMFDGDLDADLMPDEWERSYLGSDSGLPDIVAFGAGGDTDGDGVTHLREYLDGSNPLQRLSFATSVTWVNPVGSTVQGSNGGLKRGSAAAGWTADANSSQRLLADGSVVFKVIPGSHVSVGLTMMNNSRSSTDLEYRITVASDGTVGAMRPESTTAINMGEGSANSVYSLRRVDGRIQFWKDDILYATSTTSNFEELMVDCSLFSPNAEILETRIYTGDVDADGLPDKWELSHLGEDAEWAELMSFDETGDVDGDGLSNKVEYFDGTNPFQVLSYNAVPRWAPNPTASMSVVDIATGRIKKIAGGSTSWNADAVAGVVMGTGFVEKRVFHSGSISFGATVGSGVAVGMNLTNDSRSQTDLDYAIVCRTAGTVAVIEKGVVECELGQHVVDSRFAIRRVGGTVEYLKDGVVRYSSGVPVAAGLLVDSSFYEVNGEILAPRMYTADLDEDLMPDDWELRQIQRQNPAGVQLNYGLLAGFLPVGDADGDGSSNINEFKAGTDPLQQVSRPLPVRWGQLVNTQAVTPSEGALKKVSGVAGFNADGIAVDAQGRALKLRSDCGLVMSAAPTGSLAVGLTYANDTRADTDLEYAVVLTATGAFVQCPELLSDLALGSYTASTVYAIRRIGAVVEFSVDGVVVYRSSTPCEGDMLVDCSLSTLNHQTGSVFAFSGDVDADGLPDAWELQYLPLNATLLALEGQTSQVDGPDSDGVSLIDEYKYGTSAALADSDGDGMPDAWEIAFGLAANDAGNKYLDADSDGLTNFGEWEFGSHPLLPDEDEDGLNDFYERQEGSNHRVADSDADGMPDGWEYSNGLGVLNSYDWAADLDGDLVPNYWEFYRGKSPIDAENAPIPDAVVSSSPVVGASPPEFASLQSAYDFLISGSGGSSSADIPLLVLVKRGIYDASLVYHSDPAKRRTIAWVAEVGVGPATSQAGEEASGAMVAGVEGAILRLPLNGGGGLTLNADGVIHGFIIEGNRNVLPTVAAVTVKRLENQGETPRVHLANVLVRNWKPQVNAATERGGALENLGGSVVMRSCTFWRCSAVANAAPFAHLEAVNQRPGYAGSALNLKNCIIWDDTIGDDQRACIQGQLASVSGSGNLIQGGNVEPFRSATALNGTSQQRPRLTVAGHPSSKSPGIKQGVWNRETGQVDLHSYSRLNIPLAPPTRLDPLQSDTIDIGASEWESGYLRIGVVEALLGNTQAQSITNVTEGDILPDWWERWHFSVVGLAALAGADPDSDGVSNFAEFMLGLNPNDPDSDDDGTNDQDVDSDGDLFPDSWEMANGYDAENPNDVPDSEKDDDNKNGIWDKLEIEAKGYLLSGDASENLDPISLESVKRRNQIVAGLVGSFDVGTDGSSNYTIPITVNKGSAGVEPQLALSYSSSAPDGVIGVGWSLAGLGAISRGPSSAVLDGIASGVNFGPTDRFSFNGDRLVFVGNINVPSRNESDYLTNGIIDGDMFYTEAHQHSRIIYHGVPALDYWTVESKGGLRMTFGQTVDSRIAPEVGGEMRAVTWAVNKVEDLLGNYYQVTYLRDEFVGSTGTNLFFMDFKPEMIEYTGNNQAGVTPYQRVVFRYDKPRAKGNTTHYVLGGRMRMLDLLSRIEMSTLVNGSTPYVTRYYDLTYEETEQDSTGRPRLTSVQEFACAGGAPNASLDKAGLPTKLVWSKSGHGWTANSGYKLPAFYDSTHGDEGRLLTDVNGDGKADVLWRNHEQVWQFNKGSTPGVSGQELSKELPVQGDHFSLQAIPIADQGARLNVGGELVSSSAYVPKVYLSARQTGWTGFELVDINGDGLVDVFGGGLYQVNQTFSMWDWNGELPSSTTNKWQWTSISNGMTFFRWINSTSYDPAHPYVKFLAEGSWNELPPPYYKTAAPTQAPAAHINTGSGWPSTGSTSNRFTPPTSLVHYSLADFGRRLVDLNGDGLLDLLRARSGETATVWMNKGDGPETSQGAAWVKAEDTDPLDAKWAGLAASYRKLFDTKTSGGFEEVVTGGTLETSAARLFTDLNGDGLPDFIVSETSSSAPYATRQDRIYFNTGSGWRKVYDSDPNGGTGLEGLAWRLPVPYRRSGRSQGVFFDDVNGDGLADFIMSRLQYSGTPQAIDYVDGSWNFVFLNTGKGWETAPNTNWVLPGYLSMYYDGADRPAHSQLVDVNGDELPDFVSTYSGRSGVWLNTGNGWGSGVDSEYQDPLGSWNLRSGEPSVDLPNPKWRKVNETWAVPTGLVAAWNSTYPLQITDMNGDGVVDLLRPTTAPDATVWLGNGQEEVITGIIQGFDDTHGLGQTSTIGYVRQNAGATDEYTGGKLVYDSEDAAAIVDDTVELLGPELVVFRTTAEDGKGGLNESHYRYGKRLGSRKGRGDLGFAWIETWGDTAAKGTGALTKVRSRSTMRQDYPFTGLAVKEESWIALSPGRVGGATGLINGERKMSESVTEYENKTVPGAKWVFPVAKRSTSISFDLESGAKLESSQVENVYSNDQWANLTVQTVKNWVGDPASAGQDGDSSKTLTNVYYSEGETVTDERWMLARLRKTTSLSKARGPTPSVTKTSAFTYFANGMIQQEVVEGGGACDGIAYGSEVEVENLPLPGGAVVKSYEYDSFGNAVKVTSYAPAFNGAQAVSQVVRDVFDPRGRFSITTIAVANDAGDESETHEENHVTRRVYDNVRSTLLQSTDPNGLETFYEYDAFGTLLETRGPNESRGIKFTSYVRFSEMPEIRYYTMSHTRGSPAALTYHDRFGRVVASEQVGFDGRTISSAVVFNSQGQPIKKSQPYFTGDPVYWEDSFFDEVGREWKSIVPGTNQQGGTEPIVVINRYEGFKATQEIMTEGKTVVSSVEVNALDPEGSNARVRISVDKRIANESSQKMVFYSTADGLDWKTVSSNGQVIEKEYSEDGRRDLKKLKDPDAGTTTTVVDGMGRVFQQTVPHGNGTQTFTYTYDKLGRQKKKSCTSGWVWESFYDKPIESNGGNPWKGAVFKVSGTSSLGGPEASRSFSYDSFGRVTSVTERLGAESWTSTNKYGINSGNLVTFGKVIETKDAGNFVMKAGFNKLGFAQATMKADGTLLHRVNSMDVHGNVVHEVFGNGVVATAAHDRRTGRLATMTAYRGGTLLQKNSYKSDNFGNIHTRTRHAVQGLSGKVENFGYDAAERMTHAKVGVAATGEADFVYDDSGNILSKAGVGSYIYYGDKKNRLEKITRSGNRVQKFEYDVAGRVKEDYFVGGVGRRRLFSYTSFGQVERIEAERSAALSTAPGEFTEWGLTKIGFSFDASGGRMRQVKDQVQTGTIAEPSIEALRTTTTYLGAYEMEYVQDVGRSLTHTFEDADYVRRELRHYFPGGVYIERAESATPVGKEILDSLAMTTEWTFHLGDNQGSTEVVTDGQGNMKERQSYTPWGERREADSFATTTSNGRKIGSRVKPGYTGHEMLDDVGIVHMNGRLYDPEIGRMMSPDPLIQAPDNTQSYNAYSYVVNNPMRFTDPSGYSWFGDLFKKVGQFFKKVFNGVRKLFKKVHRWIKKNYRAIIVIAVAVVATVLTYGAATAGSYEIAKLGFWGLVKVGAVSGAGMAASQAALAGGTWSDILRAGVTGAVTGAISAAIGAKVLHGLSVFADEAANFGSWFGWHALRSAGHGVVGGGLSELTGGNFKDGFIGAGVGALLSPMTGALNKGLGFGAPGDGGTGWQFLGRTATAGVVGGTATAISGGKFGNGAVTAAFMHVVNEEAVGLAERWAKDVRMEAWASDRSLKRAFLVNSKASDLGDRSRYSSGATFKAGVQNKFGGTQFDISDPNWALQYAKHVETFGRFDLVGIVDHGTEGTQWFVKANPGLQSDSDSWSKITSGVTDGGAVALFGCNVGGGCSGRAYVADLALSVKERGIAVFAGTSGYRGKHAYFASPGVQLMFQYRGGSALKEVRVPFSSNVD